MAESSTPGMAQRLTIRLMGLQPGASQDDMVAALRRLYRGKSEDEVRKVLARLPITLTRSSTEDQTRMIRNLLEAKGAILEIAYGATGPLRVPQSVAPQSKEAPATRAPIQAPSGPSRPQAPSSPVLSPPSASEPGPEDAVPIPSGVPGRRPGLERRARPRIHRGVQLEPMEVGEILDRSFRLLRERFWVYLIIMVIPLVIVALAMAIVGAMFGGAFLGLAFGQGLSLGSLLGMVLIGLIVFCVFLAAQAWSQGALVHAVSENYLGRETGVMSAYGATRPILARLAGTILLMGVLLILVTIGAGIVSSILFWLGGVVGAGILNILIGLIGLLVLLVPAFWLLMNWLLADKVVVLEGVGGWKALQRSRELMSARTEPGFWKGPKVKATILTLVAGIIALGILVIFQAPKILVGFVWPGSVLLLTFFQLAYIVGNALATSYWAISLILYYYDIRVRKEGFDLKMMAENL